MTRKRFTFPHVAPAPNCTPARFIAAQAIRELGSRLRGKIGAAELGELLKT
jgi:hypothetical protein